MSKYFTKFRGCKDKTCAPFNLSELLWAMMGLIVSISCIAALQGIFFGNFATPGLIMAPFGASAMLIFSTPNSPYSQPRHIIMGHMFSAFSGVLMALLFKDYLWLACGSAVALAFFIMELTKSMHPPGGATALLAVIGGTAIHDLGFYYVFIPTGLGAIILMLIALFFNNISHKRHYPKYWW